MYSLGSRGIRQESRGNESLQSLAHEPARGLAVIVFDRIPLMAVITKLSLASVYI